MFTAFTGMGVAKGDKLEEFVKSKVPVVNIEDLKMPFAAVAADLNRGTRVVLDKGSVARAVRASSAIPGVFPPVDHQGKMLVDGGVIDNIPVSVAREKGADIVIAVDISENVINFNITNLLDVMLQSITIMGAENAKYKKKEADVLISPKVGDVGMQDFTQKKRCMMAGIEATQKAMPEIKAKIEEWGGSGRRRSEVRRRLMIKLPQRQNDRLSSLRENGSPEKHETVLRVHDDEPKKWDIVYWRDI